MSKEKINLYEEFADKQVVDNLIREINDLTKEFLKLKLMVEQMDIFIQKHLITLEGS